MVIHSLCTHCQAEHELSRKLAGDTIYCQKCGQPFVVKETRNEGPRTIALHSSFENKNPWAVDEAASAQQSKLRARNGKHSLTVRPPPKEHWSAKTDSDDPEVRFPRFEHDSRAVQKFLRRHEVSDYSWLLLAGMIFTTLLVLAFLGFVIYLIVK